MSDITLTDVTIHIDKDTDATVRSQIENGLRTIDGVISVHLPEDKPHLVLVEYDPEATRSSHLLALVKELAGHAEMIGL